MVFNNAFEELNHDSNENQQTDVHNDDADDAVNVIIIYILILEHPRTGFSKITQSFFKSAS